MTEHNPKPKEPAKPPPKIKHEDTDKFMALDRMMRESKGVQL